MDEAADPLVGTTIQDSFRIDKKLGQGGMGAIYLAEHLRLKKKVAIKCLHAGLASNPEVIRRFKNEAVAASSIGHPHIINVMDMGQFGDGTFFMVLEFLDGHDWQQQLDKSGAQPPAEVAHIGLQICAALGAASAKGIVHRDLKPENIFLIEKLGDKNFVKVLDFGISKILDSSGGATKTGALMGTPYYMSPEQVLGKKEVTHLADIYALGVIFFQALSGAVPFEGETLAQIILKIAHEPTPSLAKRAPLVPLPFSRLVGQMMQKDPSYRPQSFDEVAEKLLSLLSESSPTATSASLPVFDPRQVPKGVWAALALVFMTGSWFILAPNDEDLAKPIAPATDATSNKLSTEQTDSVRLQISTVPADAKLFLDKKPLKNPFDGKLAKDNVSHELIVQREGFQSESRKMLLTSDQIVVIPLTETPTKSVSPQKSGSTKQSEARAESGSSSRRSPSPSPSPESEKVMKPIRSLGKSIERLF